MGSTSAAGEGIDKMTKQQQKMRPLAVPSSEMRWNVLH